MVDKENNSGINMPEGIDNDCDDYKEFDGEDIPVR